VTRCVLTCRTPGANHAHCKARDCHQTFATVSAFDSHRRDGRCVEPWAVGLVEVAGLWATPEQHAANIRRTAALRTP